MSDSTRTPEYFLALTRTEVAGLAEIKLDVELLVDKMAIRVDRTTQPFNSWEEAYYFSMGLSTGMYRKREAERGLLQDIATVIGGPDCADAMQIADGRMETTVARDRMYKLLVQTVFTVQSLAKALPECERTAALARAVSETEQFFKRG